MLIYSERKKEMKPPRTEVNINPSGSVSEQKQKTSFNRHHKKKINAAADASWKMFPAELTSAWPVTAHSSHWSQWQNSFLWEHCKLLGMQIFALTTEGFKELAISCVLAMWWVSKAIKDYNRNLARMCLKAENFQKIHFQALTEKTCVPQNHSLSNWTLVLGKANGLKSLSLLKWNHGN